MSEFTIRAASLDDLPTVIDLIRELAQFEKLPGPDAAAESRLVSDFHASNYHLLVAEDAGRIVGYALYFMTYSSFLARPSLYLEDLFVRPKSRRKGIATAFMRQLMQNAAAAGCGRFEWTVLDWNTPAQAFYRSLGADVLPEWRICRIEGETLLAAAAAGRATLH